MARRCFPVAKIGSSNLPGVVTFQISFFSFYPTKLVPPVRPLAPVLPYFRARVPTNHPYSSVIITLNNYTASSLHQPATIGTSPITARPFLSPLEWFVYPPPKKEDGRAVRCLPIGDRCKCINCYLIESKLLRCAALLTKTSSLAAWCRVFRKAAVVSLEQQAQAIQKQRRLLRLILSFPRPPRHPRALAVADRDRLQPSRAAELAVAGQAPLRIDPIIAEVQSGKYMRHTGEASEGIPVFNYCRRPSPMKSESQSIRSRSKIDHSYFLHL